MLLNMKSIQTMAVLSGLTAAVAAFEAGAVEFQLPAEAALPVSAGTTRGLNYRVIQAPQDAVVGNNFLRALRQVNGTLTDAGGVAIPNEAIAGPGAGGAYTVSAVNFERDGNFFDVVDLQGNWVTDWFPETFPGIPGTGGHTDNFAVEVVAYVQLPAGKTTMGVTAGADRTDVNDDDGWVLFVGRNPRDFFSTRLTEYQRIAPPFQSDSKSENLFDVVAPQAGLYPFRLVYWQTGRGANLQWYTMDAAGIFRFAINDPGSANAVPAFAVVNDAAANGPYVAEASPSGGSAGNPSDAPVTALIIDGQSTVATAGVRLQVDGSTVTPQTLTKDGDRITVAYNPYPQRADATTDVVLEYTDSASVVRSAAWSYGINVSGGSATTVTGQWDFTQGNLAATIGSPLAYLDPLTQAGTEFGTTTSFGIADIGGEAAQVMKVPGDLSNKIGYVMNHGIAPNGGGTRVNQFTIIYDLFVATEGSFAASLLQTSSGDNTDDGDLFWQQGNFGQGGEGYNGRGTFTAGEWHRVAAAYDMAATPPVVVKYVDGIKQDDWTAGASIDAARRTLGPVAVLFGDGDADERREMYVNSVQVRAGRMTDAELALLGGPSAAGIPLTLPGSNVTGQWDFAFGDLGATVGSDLAYLAPLTEQGTLYGVTGEGDFAAVPPINGEPARVMYVPGDLSNEIGYVMDHRIAPNGGGTRVNQFTVVMDVMIGTSGSGAAGMLQTSSETNGDDGDLFWQGGNFGQGGEGYNGRGTFTAGEWHRVVAAYDMAANPPVVTKYVDGIKQDDWTAGAALDAPRRTMAPTAVLFADGDADERREWWVSSVQVRSGKLTDAQIAALGGPSAAGIPIATPVSTVTGHWDFAFGDLGANIGEDLAYLAPLTEQGTRYGVTGEGDFLDIPGIDGQPASVMYVPGDLSNEIGYVMTHRIPPNGGGTRVNQFTLVMDVMIGTTGSGAAGMLQTSSETNGDDGDLFWQGNNFGQGGEGYNGTGAFTPGEWHRVVAAYDMAANPPVVTKYVDGIFQDDWTAGAALDAPRRTMAPTAVLFADGDADERREWWVSAVQIRAGALSKAEIESMGGPSAAGIPIVLSVAPPAAPPVLSVALGEGNVTVSWPADATGVTLESSPTLVNPAWTPVGGVTGNSATIPTSGDGLFLRLR